MDLALLLVPIGYVIGMVQSAEIVGRVVGRDPRSEGSRNPGASNMYRLAGRKPGVVVLLLDVAKGVIAAAMGLAVDGTSLGLACGLAAMVGHVFPAIRGFNGGKGVATFAGFVVVLWPIAGLAGLAAWTAGIVTTRRAAIGSLLGVIASTCIAVVAGATQAQTLALVAGGLLIAWRHRENMVRLVRGEEPAIRA